MERRLAAVLIADVVGYGRLSQIDQAIERALSLQGVGTAAAEQNILVLDDSIEILTQGPAGRWS